MPTKHSKNNCDNHHYTYGEKKAAGLGSIKQRLGSDSQLPFGYCPLSLAPISDAVVSPSGHIYSRESILEYLLTKTQELKAQARAYELQQERKALEARREAEERSTASVQRFAESTLGISEIVSQAPAAAEDTSSHWQSRKRLIDETDRATSLEELKRVNPWIVQFTPTAADREIEEPPKRPPSPFSGRPLRAKDLIPVDLVREPVSSSAGASASGSISSTTTRFICPVSRDTITNQKLVLLKNTGTLMIEDVAKSLAMPTMQCPLTGRSFSDKDVLPIVPAASAFAASGNVEAKRYRPNYN